MIRYMKPLLLLVAPLLVAAPASAQPRPIPYGSPQRAEGAYRTGFESSDFQGCWVTFTDRGRAEFDRLRPAIQNRVLHGIGAWQVSWLIRRTPDATVRFQGYGHLGMSKCQVEVVRVFRVARLR